MKSPVYALLLLLCGSLAASAQSGWDFCPPLTHIKLNSSFGYRIHPLTGKPRFHEGIDLAARHDTVFALMDGVVAGTAYEPGLGLRVVLDHTGGTKSSYGHLSQWWVCRGDSVKAGDPIGLTGATGQVTGEHLHFAIKYHNRFLNPLAFLRALLRRRAGLLLTQYANHE